MNQVSLRNALLATVGVALVAGVAPAAAQMDPGDEIIVTARRQAETLQDVPASVSVLTEQAIASAGVRNAEDISRLTPGVTIVTGTAEVGDTQVNIRGLNGARDAEPSVALVVDGILKTNTAALNQAQGDLVQVEVLKGPQGAFYGRNAAAGAVILSTRRPGDRLEGRFRAAAAEDNTWELFGSVSGPIGEGIGLLVNAEYRTTDGYYRNTGPIAEARGATVDYQETLTIGARLIIAPDDLGELDIKGRVTRTDAGAIAFNGVFQLPNFAALNPLFNEDVNARNFVFQPNILPLNRQRGEDISVRFTRDLWGGAITAWVAYSNVRQDLSADGTSGAFGFFNADGPCRASVSDLNASGFQLPAPQFLGEVPDSSLFVPNGSLFGPYTPTLCDGTQYQVRNQSDISAEVRWASDPDQPLRWQVGTYWLEIDREVGVNLAIDRGFGVIRELFTTDPRNPTEQLVHDQFDTRVLAGFGAIDWDVSEQFTVNLALRYDNERRRVTNLVPPGARTQYVDFDGPPFEGNAPLNPGLLFGPILPKTRTFDQWQPKVSLAWKPTPQVTVFGNWGIGFKAGGFNNQGSRATIDLNFNGPLGTNIQIFDDFEKETSSAFEAGFRVTSADGRFSVSGAGYYTQVTDMQFFEFFVGTFGLLRVVSNIDKVDLWGAELAATARITDWWRVDGAVNLTESEIKRNSARPATVGNKSPYTADYTVNLGTSIDAPLGGDWAFMARADLRITGPTWFSTVQAQQGPTLFTAILPLAGLPAELGTGDFTLSRRDSFTILDLRAGVRWRDLSLTAFATNVTDERWLAEVIPAPEFGGAFVSPGSRRRIGAEIRFQF
ncbi:MAG: TonB-dependent receptor [Thermaurantiacus sp.]